MSTSKISNQKRYPGAAIDAADNDQENRRLEKQATCRLNNNPRNNPA